MLKLRDTVISMLLLATSSMGWTQIYEAPKDLHQLFAGKRLDTLHDPPATVEGPVADDAFRWHAFASLGTLLKDPSQMPAFEARWRRWSLPSNIMRDGMPHVVRFEGGILGYFEMGNTWEAYPKQIEALEKAWPNHPLTPLIRSAWHQANAWKARGLGSENTVSKAGLQRFEFHMKESRKVLEAAPPASREFALWYRLKFNSWADGKVTIEQLHDTLTEAIKKFPANPQPYWAVLDLITPRNFGSYEQVNAFMEWALKNSLPGSPNETYAFLAWSLGTLYENPATTFKRAGVQWSRVRSGFDALIKRYPRSNWIPNSFAYFACRVNDRPTFMRLKESVRLNPMEEAWTNGYSFENCSMMIAKAL